MESHTSQTYQKNFQQIGPELTSGPWAILSKIDPVSEKKYLYFKLQAAQCSLLHPIIFSFRSEAAVEISAGRCPHVLDIDKKEASVGLLTPFLTLLDKSSLAFEEIKNLVAMVIKTLARFEAFHFTAYGLSLDTIGRDENGGFFLLPSAYVLPFPVESGNDGENIAPHELKNWINGFYWLETGKAHSHHLSALKDIIKELQMPASSRGSSAPGKEDFLDRLEELAAELEETEHISLAEIYPKLFDECLEASITRYLQSYPPVLPPGHIEKTADEINTMVRKSGGVIVLKGGAFSGKSAAARMAAKTLWETGSYNVAILDEWNLFYPGRKKNNSSLPERSAVFVDNIDEKAFIYSYLATEALKGDLPPENRLILSTDPAHTSGEAIEFLKTISSISGDRYREIPIEAASSAGGRGPAIHAERAAAGDPSVKRTRDHLIGILQRLSTERSSDPELPPEQLITRLLSLLKDEEKQLLEFVSIARFSVPLDVIASLFPRPRKQLSKAIHRLAALDLLELRYRYFSQRDSIFVLLSIKNNSIGRLIYMNIPKARRKNLSRTIPLLAEEHGAFPPFHYLYHLLKGEEKTQAAKYCVAYFKKHKGKSRPLFCTILVKNLLDNGLFEILPFHGRIFVLSELSEDLLADGDSVQAEKLLLGAVDILSDTKVDKQIKHASLIMSTCRKLADIWEAKGEYKKSLDLLERTRETLQSCLPLPDQARLLNDIGWLQYRLGDYERSMASCKLSLTSLNANQHPLVVAQALNIMGVVHFNTSRYDEAISYYEQSVFLRERGKDDNALSASYNNLGLVNQTKGEYEKALDYYNKSLEIKVRQNNQAGIAAAALNLALLYLEMHNFSEAEEKCRESLKISKKLGITQLTAENLITLGDISLMRGKHEQAEDHYRHSLKISRKIETINEEMGALRRLSNLYLLQKRYQEVEDCISKASKLAQRIGSKFESAQIDLIIGDLECTQKKHMEAIKHYEKAASSFMTLSNYRQAAPVLAKIGIIHAEGNNALEARQFMDRAHDLVRSDIGHELPEELVTLQHLLRSHPLRTSLPQKASQKLLMTFYELGALSDYALDRHEFFKKAQDIVQQIINPEQCYLAMKEENDQFTLFDCTGEQAGVASEGQALLFSRTLLLGCLLESNSPDVSTILPMLHQAEGTGFASIPLKAMGEDLGCLFLSLRSDLLPLSKEDATFFTSLGRQIAGNLRLMLHFEEHAYKEEKLEKEYEDLKAQFEDKYRFENLIGKSEEMKKIFRTLNKIKNMIPGILIIGESGTGKTELARAIHYNGPRRGKPFQEIHCAQIPTTLLESELFGHERGAFTGAVQRKLGLCELADGGTIFLDDINVIPMETQTKLLHFLESKSFMHVGGTKKITSNVRIIAASNEDLEKLCKEQKFREDLYYRLKVILITIPPLRERKEDIIAIALAFLKKRCSEKGIPMKTLAPETIKLFQKTPWRGNVRELQNVLERVVLLSDDSVIYPGSLPEDVLKEISGSSPHQRQSAEVLVQEIIGLENYSESNPLMPQMEALFARTMVDYIKAKGKAATFLGITKPTLYTRLEKYKRLE